MECLAEDAVLRFLRGGLESADAGPIHAHLAECEDCRAVVGDVALSLVTASEGKTPGADSPPPASDTPHRVARYEIQTTLGVGGMGVVFAAFDPQLDRRVALKLLRADRQLADAEAQKARLLREAQSMARLSHPNVVPVYDAGVFGEQVFVIMELVTGRTLRAWMREKGRTWQEMLDLHMQAGAGLAAAHAAGIVHRDFKPENVLVGDDGRVRVSDFGLARAAFAAGAPIDAEGSVAIDVTASFAFAGTPAYMAPEQFRGDAVDQRADQFAFCVSLFEGLFGRRPFRGGTIDELSRSVMSGAPEPPAKKDIPPDVTAAVMRGLATSPADRHPSIDALLRALEDARAKQAAPTTTTTTTTRRWPLIASLGAAVSIVAVVFAWPRAPAAVPASSSAPTVSALASSAPAEVVAPPASSVVSWPVASLAPARLRPRVAGSARTPSAAHSVTHGDALIGNPWNK